jgi:hypothetical protein
MMRRPTCDRLPCIQIADAVRDEFPNVLVDTFAYANALQVPHDAHHSLNVCQSGEDGAALI